MADYKLMYYALFKEVTIAIEHLQKAQQITEEIYIKSEKAQLSVFNADDAKDNKS